MERRSHCLLLAVLESQTATPLPDLRGEKISFSIETFTSSRCRHLSEFGVQEEDLPVRDKHECRVHIHISAKSVKLLSLETTNRGRFGRRNCLF